MSATDRFGLRAEEYARYRPTYPDELFELLLRLVPARDRAWDCGAGSGQTARRLATSFARVLATDTSRRQLERAPAGGGIERVLAAAEAAPFRASTVDLVTVSAALHWFDRPRFYDEVRRVARPGAIVAVWSYYHSRIDPAVDAVLVRFAEEVVGALWPPPFQINRDRYHDLDFPFERLPWPELEAEARMRVHDLMQYMRTWSSSQAWERSIGTDPVDAVRAELLAAWGDPARERTVRWPLHGAIGRVR